MRTVRALTLLALVAAIAAVVTSACADSTNTTTSDAGATTSEAPPTTSGTTAGQSLSHLRDGSTITQADSNRDFAITDGDRAELQLNDDYSWSDPQIAGPGELVPIPPSDDADYVAWELVTKGSGNLIISATGIPDCAGGDCNLEDLAFAVSIAVRRP